MTELDSAPPPEANPDPRRGRRRGPSGPLGYVWASTLMGWRWLTRMRTALYLLAALAVATLVATVVPQEPNVPTTVDSWLAGTEGPGATVAALLDVLGAFDVYGSLLFTVLLFLLYLSLTACLVPRIRSWVRLVRRSQPPRSTTVGRQPRTAHLATDRSVEEVHAAARDLLAERRWRLRAADADPDLPAQVAAEKGLWSREGGSLVFHVSFYVLLGAVVYGQVAGFTGQVGVTEGAPGFADTPVAYWTQSPGAWWQDGDHAGWSLDLDHFEIDWVRDPLAPGAGQPTTFASDVTVTLVDGTVVEDRIEGNAPVSFDGMKVTQLDWGYAPRVQVEVDGEVVFDDLITATATDGGFFRSAVKAPAADPDVGLEIFLHPFAPAAADGSPQLTGAPWDDAPLLTFRQYRGDLQLGRTPQSVTQLDTSQLTSTGGGILRLGASLESPDGVTVRFLELRRWVGFQVSNRPQLGYLLLGALLLLGGLWPALYAYRRRLWVQATRDPSAGRTLVAVGGRAFQRPEVFEDEHADIVRALAEATGADTVDPDVRPDPDADPTVPSDPAPTGAGR